MRWFEFVENKIEFVERKRKMCVKCTDTYTTFIDTFTHSHRVSSEIDIENFRSKHQWMNGIESQIDFPSIFIYWSVYLSICLLVSSCACVPLFQTLQSTIYERLHNICLMFSLHIFLSLLLSVTIHNTENIRKNSNVYHTVIGVTNPNDDLWYKDKIVILYWINCKIANKIVRIWQYVWHGCKSNVCIHTKWWK